MGLSVHQISPKPLQVDSWNAHIVNVLPRQRSNSFQIFFYCPFYQLRSQSRSRSPGFGQNAVAIYCAFANTQCGWPRPEPRVRVKQFSQSEFSSDINYHPNLAKINVQGCIVITPSLGELNCDRLHIILITFTYIITPLLLLPHINPCWQGLPSSTNYSWSNCTISN